MNHPLKLAFITAYYREDENCTGLASYYYNLATALADAGHQVFVITVKGIAGGTGDSNNLRCIAVKQNLYSQSTVTAPSMKSVLGLAARMTFSFAAMRRVIKLDRKFALDLIIAPELFAQGLCTALWLKSKLVTRIHTPSEVVDFYNQRYPSRWLGRLNGFPERLQVRLSRGIYAASPRLASEVARHWRMAPDNIRIIPNGIHCEWVRRSAGNYKRSIPCRYMLYFGRLERRKGVSILATALAAVFAGDPDICMVFVGRDCGWKEKIMAENSRYSARIKFYDTLSKEHLFEIVLHSTLVILPSLFENFANTGLEAMALGKVVIGTTGTSFEDLITDGENGFLVPPGDAASLSAKILECLRRDDLDRIGENAYQHILQYDMSEVVKQHVNYFREILRGSA